MDLQDIPGVQHVSVDYATGKAVVESSREISTDEIRKVIEQNGYGVQFNS
jgi:copper chaperone CopZ